MDLTIFIITFNRPQFINFLLNFLIKKKYNSDIIIVDGSEKKFKKKTKIVINKIKDLYRIKNNRIRYYHSENQLEIISKLEKNIKTRFCLFTYDDDIPGKEFIDESLKFLKSNKDYVSTNGFFGTSNISFKNKKTKLRNVKFSNMKRNNIFQNTIEKRFLNFNYNEGFAYGVYRKKDFINIFRIVKTFCNSIKNPVKKVEHVISHRLMTITFATYNLIKGKIKKFDKIMMIRINHQYNQTSNNDYFDKIGGWHVIDFHKNNSLYIEILTNELNKIFKSLDRRTILNLIYLHVYLRASKRLPRYFYYVHKSLNNKAFSIGEKLSIFINFPFYIFFRFSRLLEKFRFLNKIIFFHNNAKEISNIEKFQI